MSVTALLTVSIIYVMKWTQMICKNWISILWFSINAINW